MGWVNRLFKSATEFRGGSLENPQTPLSFPAEWLLDIFNGGRTDSGIRVSEMTALQVGTVYACCNVISGAMAAMPLHVYEHVKDDEGGRVGKNVAYKHPYWDLLHNNPNEEMTSFTWMKVSIIHALLWGNMYTEIERNPGNNQIIGLWPRNPARTRPIRLIRDLIIEGTLYKRGTMCYETSEDLLSSSSPSVFDNNKELMIGRKRIILAEDMVHVPGLSLDGRLGQDVVYLARQIIGLALATEKYGAKFFGNGARPAGVLTIPNKMEDKALENLRRSWAEAHGGENQFKVAVLEQGIKFEKIAATPEEGQMLATRQYQRTEICAIFNVPQHMVAAAERGGRGVTEQASIEFVLYSLNPWMVAIEQEVDRKLFPKQGRSSDKFFPHFDSRKYLYPSADSRSKIYQVMKEWGIANSDEIRELEDMNPTSDGSGKIYTVQNHMINAKVLAKMKDLPQGLASVDDAATANAKLQVDNNAIRQPAAKPSQSSGGKKKPAAKAKRSVESTVEQYVMRHGTTDANIKDREVYRGWGPYHLDETGKKAAAEAAQSLKGKGIKYIVTSHLARHVETAQIASAELGNIPIVYDEGWKTLHVGIYTGQKREDVGDDLQWYLDNPDEVIPGGESVDFFRSRVTTAFADSRIANEKAGPSLVITSRSPIAALEHAGISGGDVKVAEPGGIYKLDGDTLKLIYGKLSEDSIAGT